MLALLLSPLNVNLAFIFHPHQRQVPEPIQQEAQEVETVLEECQSVVMEEQGRLAWAVLRVGQLVRAMSIMVKYRDTEKRLRFALRERIKEQQAIKEKVRWCKGRLAMMWRVSNEKNKFIDGWRIFWEHVKIFIICECNVNLGIWYVVC